MEVIESVENHRDDSHQLPGPKAALTPPTSEDMEKRERSSSDLSDIEEEDDDIGDVEPDHFYDGGNIPVFKPTMQQFKSFRKFIDKIDRYGMKSGIVKVIPPKEWRDSLPDLADKVKTIKVKNPITQEFAGQHGVYTQANIEKQRSYNLPQWKALTEETHHQPPAKRGERRNNQAVVARSRSTRVQTPVDPDAPKRKPGRPPRNRSALKNEVKKEDSVERDTGVASRPSTPSAKGGKPTRAKKIKLEDDSPSPVTKGRQPKSISSRRKNNQGDVNEDFDEEAFKGFQYRLESVEDYTPERCKELETLYWKTINFAHPMYGADMPGSLFDESTDNWNVAKLENLLDVLGTKVPGVNTAYLYLGMWKATFAWHLEDVDLYSINYIHFGAPKQWYSISQQDARRFENAMKTIWPNDFKNCSQFLRHKTYLISPSQLESQFNIKVNRLVHNEGEFVITYPYGYHSGYNLGYNCAESVNFATEAWLEFGKIAKKCDCEADSVWVDVSEIERKLRGEPTPEYYEETDDEDDEDDVQHDLPSPPASVKGKPKAPTRKRKRNTGAKDQPPVKTKRIKIRVRIPSKEPCVLCPNEALYDKLLPTDNGQKAHRLCALYTPETFISEEDGFERVCNVAHIEKARLDLKCNFCRSKRGACFQCSSRKCTRAFHATCAAAAGVLVDTGPVPTFDEDGTEYFCEGYDFRCKVHRPRRPKHMEVEALENNKLVQEFAKGVKPGEVVQAQWLQGDPVAGVVLENRTSEGTVIIDVLPAGSHVEVEWKYLLVLDPKDSQRPKPSPSAKELPLHLNNSKNFNAKNQKDGPPEIDTPFHDPNAGQKWAEFNTCFAEEVRNPFQIKINLDKPLSLWYYLGKNSTEARPQYTGDASKQVHDIRSNFLETVKPPPRPPAPVVRRTAPGPYPTGANVHALNGAMASQRAQMQQPIHGPDKPYEYKPK
ncbi:JmjC-domain-containing protein, partial [Patellaria atrata CBS 101060]